MDYALKIMSIEDEPNGVKKFTVPKPNGYKFIPGSSVNISVNKPGLEENKKIGTFFSLNSDFYIEIVFKEDATKADTKPFFDVKAGEELILSDIVPGVEYKGKGVYIASGKGVLPFLNIFKHLKSTDSLSGNSLIYFARDNYEVLYERAIKHLLAGNASIVLGKDSLNSTEVKKFDETTLKQKVFSMDQQFYVAGPRYFVDNVSLLLDSLGIRAHTHIID